VKFPGIKKTLDRAGESYPADQLKHLVNKKKSEHNKLIERERKDLVISIVNEYLYGIRTIGGQMIMREMKEEFVFDEGRDWSFDLILAFVGKSEEVYNIAFEIEGGIHSGGRHVRGKGYTADCEKYNAAQLMDIQVIRFTTDHFKEPYTYIRETLKAAMESKL
jgi:hypothetical protein